ncbi:MAG: tetratricopeptide repeat protein, partial [Phycisphaerae bacterium]
TAGAGRRRWGLGALVFGLASVLYAIITVVPLVVPDRQKRFLAEVDRQIAQKSYAQAERQLRARLADGAAGSEYALRLGICQSMQGRYEAARQTFDQALARQPDEPRLLYNRALLDYRQGSYSEALRRLERLAKLAPYFPGVHYHMGRVHEIQDRPDRALQCYVAELNIDPASSSTWRRYLYLVRELRKDQSSRSADSR